MNKKFLTFAVGWIRVTSNGEEYISATTTKNEKAEPMKLYCTSGDKVYEINSFSVFFNRKKQNSNSPDVKFNLKVDE